MIPLTIAMLFLAPEPICQVRRTDDSLPLIESERIRHVLSRFAFGPSPGMVARISEIGLAEWFEAQLEGEADESPLLRAKLDPLGSLELSNQEVLQAYRQALPEDPKERAKARRLREAPRREVKDAVLLRSIFGANRLRETASDFFRNHLNVDIDKGDLRYYVGEYEREVLRANVLGDFGDLLMQSAKHPAMLLYLDNALSRRPPTKQELREIERKVRRKTGSSERASESVEIARQRGLNENYARELLELHTLGVDNHYTQRDIIEVAKVLTGWTVQRNPEKPVTFQFRADMHVSGDKRILGAVIRKDRDNPVTEGERVIEGLVEHSGTARFLAWKLCRYLVADDPPQAMVDRITKVFQKSDGHLPTVYRAIFEDPDFFAPEFFQCKFKRPFEFVVSALRITAAEVNRTAALQRALTQLSEPIYECEDPTGYYDQAEAWNDPGVMAVRWRFATDLVLGKIDGVKVPDSLYDDLHPTIPRVWKDQLARRVLAVRMSPQTSAAIDRMVQRHLEESPIPKTAVLAPRILGMLLGSPEFQRQ